MVDVLTSVHKQSNCMVTACPQHLPSVVPMSSSKNQMNNSLNLPMQYLNVRKCWQWKFKFLSQIRNYCQLLLSNNHYQWPISNYKNVSVNSCMSKIPNQRKSESCRRKQTDMLSLSQFPHQQNNLRRRVGSEELEKGLPRAPFSFG